jgi:hypothetical protein
MANIGALQLTRDDYLKYNLRSQMFAKSLPMIHYWLIETFRVVAK